MNTIWTMILLIPMLISKMENLMRTYNETKNSKQLMADVRGKLAFAEDEAPIGSPIQRC